MDTTFLPSTDDVEVALHDLGGNGPALLLAHANGFHGRVWQPVAAELAEVAHCYALDIRGHGVTRTPDDVDHEWAGVGDDVAASVDYLFANGLAIRGELDGAGWSMGGCGLAMAEQGAPGRFRGLWLFEPIIFPAALAPPRGLPNPLAESARRRREVFANRDEAFENYLSKPPFSTVAPTALRAYVEHGFDDLDDGTIRLRCRGETEGGFFSARHGAAYAGLGSIDLPVTVVGSGDGMPPSQIAPTVAQALPDGTFEPMTDLNHFGPMQDPSRIAASIRAGLRR